MESYPAKKANKAKKALDAIFSLEWEERALSEVIQAFQAAWGNYRERFETLTEENESIALEEKNLPQLQSNSKDLIDLYERIFQQLIFREPYLYRMLAYITMNPEDREARKAFFERYLSRDICETYYNILTFENILEGSDLAKSMNLSGIPVHACFVGKVLMNLLDEAESQRMTDNGNPEHFKVVKAGKSLIFEYFKQADYESPLVDKQIDEILYDMIHKAQKDRRQGLFFGRDLDKPEYRIIKRFDGEEKSIPFQLLPKYAGLIRQRATNDRECQGIKRFDGKNPLEDWQDFENKSVSLFLEAVLDQAPGKIKPVKLPFAAFIEKQLTWRKGEEWDKQSIQVNGKRIKRDALDQHGDSLDEGIDQDDNDDGSRHDVVADKKAIGPERNLLDKERADLSKDIRAYLSTTTDEALIRLIRIHAQEGRRSEADQKFYNRKWNDKLKEIQEMFGLSG